jgi:hypothetical protein
MRRSAWKAPDGRADDLVAIPLTAGPFREWWYDSARNRTSREDDSGVKKRVGLQLLIVHSSG